MYNGMGPGLFLREVNAKRIASGDDADRVDRRNDGQRPTQVVLRRRRVVAAHQLQLVAHRHKRLQHRQALHHQGFVFALARADQVRMGDDCRPALGDVAKGINSFKKGLADDAAPPAGTPAPPSQITSQPAPTVAREEVPRS